MCCAPPEASARGGRGRQQRRRSHLRGGGDGAFVAARAVLLVPCRSRNVRALVSRSRRWPRPSPRRGRADRGALRGRGCATRRPAESTVASVRVLDAPPAANDKWLAWRAGRSWHWSVPTTGSEGRRRGDTIMLLDGHELASKELVALVRIHVTGRRRAVLPSRYMSRTSGGRRSSLTTRARRPPRRRRRRGRGGQGQESGGSCPKEDSAYTSRWSPIAFTKADGVAALAAAASTSPLLPRRCSRSKCRGAGWRPAAESLAWILSRG